MNRNMIYLIQCSELKKEKRKKGSRQVMIRAHIQDLEGWGWREGRETSRWEERRKEPEKHVAREPRRECRASSGERVKFPCPATRILSLVGIIGEIPSEILLERN